MYVYTLLVFGGLVLLISSHRIVHLNRWCLCVDDWKEQWYFVFKIEFKVGQSSLVGDKNIQLLFNQRIHSFLLNNHKNVTTHQQLYNRCYAAFFVQLCVPC